MLQNKRLMVFTVFAALFQRNSVSHAAITPASVINVDFNTTNISQTPSGPVSMTPAGTYSGLAAGPATGGSFFDGITLGDKDGRVTKVFANFSSGPLLASDGTTNTGVTVSLVQIDQYDTTNDPEAAPPAVAPLMDDFAFAGTTAASFAINGLTPGSTYSLYLYSQNGGYNNESTTFTINGANEAVANTAAGLGSFVNGSNYVVFTGLSPNSQSAIDGTFISAAANQGSLDGFQLVQTAVPEPTSLTAVGAAAISLMARRRRKGQLKGVGSL